jgi:hypothetical protein
VFKGNTVARSLNFEDPQGDIVNGHLIDADPGETCTDTNDENAASPAEDTTLTVPPAPEPLPNPIFKQHNGDDPSCNSSPVHSVRTPVTENDPLGLFTPPPAAEEKTPAVSAADPPTSTPVKPSGTIEAWTPLKQNLDTKGKGKAVSRSESFSTALRSGATRFLSKISEFKHTMSPKDGGSAGSLNRIDPFEGQEEGDERLRKAGSQDALSNRSADELSVDSVDDAPRSRIRTTPGKYAHYGKAAQHFFILFF